MKTLLLIFLLLLFTHFIFAQTSQFRAGHSHDILKVKFSPDDSQLISYSWGDGRLILWNVKSGYLIWMTKTEFVQKADERYNLEEFYWSDDAKFIVTKSENGTYQTWDAKTGKILAVADHKPNITLKPEGAKKISVAKDYLNLYLTNTETKDNFTIKQFSRTGTVYDVSYDGNLFAEGGSYGNV
jgi:WD40 repeat protein